MDGTLLDEADEHCSNRSFRPDCYTEIDHCPPGTKLKAYHDGQTQQGRDYHHELLKRVNDIKTNEDFWEAMKDNWRKYLNKNKRGSFVHVAATMGGHNGAEMEEEEVSDKEDINLAHTIDLPDDDDQISIN